MQRLAANTGVVDERLLVEWPKYGESIWRIFNTLGRPSGMGGLCAINMVEIDAWQRVHDIKLSAWELGMIETFDRIAIEVSNKQDSK